MSPTGWKKFVQPNRVEDIQKDRQNRCWKVLEKGIVDFIRAHSSVVTLTK
jgi:hypothetical protein